MTGQAPTLARTPWRQSLAERPLLVLGVVLVVLVLMTGLIEPGYFSVGGVRNTLLLAAPVGILAAAQTILMLTRGIDISVAMTGTLVAYVVADQAASGGSGWRSAGACWWACWWAPSMAWWSGCSGSIR